MSVSFRSLHQLQGDKLHLVRLPRPIEFVHDMRAALPRSMRRSWSARPDEKKIRNCSLFCASWNAEDFRASFSQQDDKDDTKMHEVLKLLQPARARALILRQIPIWKAIPYRVFAISRSSARISTRSMRRRKSSDHGRGPRARKDPRALA